MYEIYFYRDKNGKEPVKDYIAGLAAKKDKNSRIKLNKIMDYLKTLSEYGTRAGEPYIKHIFMKQTQKTPQREIERAKRNFIDYQGRKHNEDK